MERYTSKEIIISKLWEEKKYLMLILKMWFRVISPGSEMAALKSGYVHFAKVNHSKEVLEELDEQANSMNLLLII